MEHPYIKLFNLIYININKNDNEYNNLGTILYSPLTNNKYNNLKFIGNKQIISEMYINCNITFKYLNQ